MPQNYQRKKVSFKIENSLKMFKLTKNALRFLITLKVK